ncbi:sprouty-related, EVH1 domain-containing protein 2-like [Apostichopus japonicus]|uniref:sprouty-related, EVH1 domain-containing protein 2-like n=1 Tax=Stichopus japonicus TaxID=307972 RepID=UPI003AB44C64
MEKKETPLDEDTCLIRVKAQVMTREDGGWVPVEEGGYSVVGIYKMDGANLGNRIAYKIVGIFVATQKRVLECPLRTHDQYTATPNFHHWRTQDEKKYGLTFSNPADARAFSRGFRRAIEDMKEGCSSSDSSVNPDDDVEETEVYPHDPLLPAIHDYKNTHPCVLVPSPKDDTKVRDLIISNTFGTQRYSHPNNHQHLHKVIYLPDLKQPRSVDKKSKDRPADENVWIKIHQDWQPRRVSHPEPTNQAYVKLVKKPQSIHEYIYPFTPQSDMYKGEDDLKKTTRGVPKVISTQPPSSPPLKLPFKPEPVRCIHCGQKFDPDNNMRGRCQDAPDELLEFIGKMTCISCAQGLIYHCVNDVDGDYVDPCSCSCTGNHFCKRWTCLAMFSLLVPCLWCYIPLRGCHWCGKQCGCCGGRHKAT